MFYYFLLVHVFIMIFEYVACSRREKEYDEYRKEREKEQFEKKFDVSCTLYLLYL